MMKALQFKQFGGPEVLELVELSRPEAAPGHILIRVARAGVNFADIERTKGTWGTRQLPQVMGVEVAGVREDTGERVVALLPGGGAYAEYAVAREDLTFSIPDDVSNDAAVALFEQGLTAYHVLRTSAHLAPGESVVIHAAAGGVGSLAVQLARIYGAGRVIAVASTPEKRALALELGADVALAGGVNDLAERLIEANGGRGVDVVLDSVGGETFDQSLRALAPFGRLVSYGQASGTSNTVSIDDLGEGSKGVIGYWLRHTFDQRAVALASLAELFKLTGEGQLRVVIGATYALDCAVLALRELEARRTHGKLLIDPWGVEVG